MAGPDGALWFAEAGALNAIGRITTAGVVTNEFNTPTQPSSPLVIALGSDGAMWFTEQNTHSIGRVTSSGSFTEYPIPSGSSPLYIATGAALWFTAVNEQTGDRIGRMTTDGVVTHELPIQTSGDECSPTGISAGPDGNVWFTCELADQIGRITLPRPAPPAPPPAPVPAPVAAVPRFTG